LFFLNTPTIRIGLSRWILLDKEGGEHEAGPENKVFVMVVPVDAGRIFYQVGIWMFRH